MNPPPPFIMRPGVPGRSLRLLSYNIQAGIDTRHYREYVTKGWKHLLPNRERLRNLNLIAEMLRLRSGRPAGGRLRGACAAGSST